MKEERLLILNMLNEDKISVDEACKLLKALNKTESSGELGGKVSAYAGNIKKKAAKIVKDAEPAVKKYTDAVSDKFENIKSGIKSKGKSDDNDEEIIVVDETDVETEDNSDDETNA